MRIYTSHNNDQNERSKRIKFCVYKKNYCGKYELVAMTLKLERIERLIDIKLNVNLTEIIKNPGDYYIQDEYLIREEYFKY